MYLCAWKVCFLHFESILVDFESIFLHFEGILLKYFGSILLVTNIRCLQSLSGPRPRHAQPLPRQRHARPRHAHATPKPPTLRPRHAQATPTHHTQATPTPRPSPSHAHAMPKPRPRHAQATPMWAGARKPVHTSFFFKSKPHSKLFGEK